MDAMKSQNTQLSQSSMDGQEGWMEEMQQSNK